MADYRMVMECGVTGIVECTGNTTVSSDAAVIALNKGINVYMVSKETDSVSGPALHQLAAKNQAVYALVNGDQPRNLVDLISWGKTLGWRSLQQENPVSMISFGTERLESLRILWAAVSRKICLSAGLAEI